MAVKINNTGSVTEITLIKVDVPKVSEESHLAYIDAEEQMADNFCGIRINEDNLAVVSFKGNDTNIHDIVVKDRDMDNKIYITTITVLNRSYRNNGKPEICNAKFYSIIPKITRDITDLIEGKYDMKYTENTIEIVGIYRAKKIDPKDISIKYILSKIGGI